MTGSNSRTIKDTDFLRLLNARLRENEVWRDLFKATSQVMRDYVDERLTKFSRIRASQHIHRGDYLTTPQGRGKVAYIRRAFDEDGNIADEVEVEVPGEGCVVVPMRTVHDRNTLIQGSRMNGFNYFSDTISDEDYARLYRYVGMFWQDTSDDVFVKFIGFVKNMHLEMEQLWTRDKGDNATSDDAEISKYDFLEIFDPNNMIPVWEGAVNGSDVDPNIVQGLDYPTSHVSISYDIVISTQIDLPDLVRMFYYLAPIHLVLERLQAAVNTEVPVYHGVVSQMHIYDHSYLRLTGLPPI